MLSDEEKEAIDYLNADVEYLQERLKNPNYIGRFITIQEVKYLKTILNLIEKQQKEIEKKDKIIDLTIKVLTDCEFDDKCQECTYDQLYQCNKEYFTKKAEEN